MFTSQWVWTLGGKKASQHGLALTQACLQHHPGPAQPRGLPPGGRKHRAEAPSLLWPQGALHCAGVGAAAPSACHSCDQTQTPSGYSYPSWAVTRPGMSSHCHQCPRYSPRVPAVTNCLSKSDHCTMEAGETPGPEVRQETALPRARLCPVPRPPPQQCPWKDHGLRRQGEACVVLHLPKCGCGFGSGSSGLRGLLG